MKFSPSIWRYVVNVKSTVKISSIFVAFLENMNFKSEKPPGTSKKSILLPKIVLTFHCLNKLF